MDKFSIVTSQNEWEDLRRQLESIAINKNYVSSLVAGAISKWVFGLKGPWQIIVATILLEVISQCSDPDRQAEAIINAALSRDNDILSDLPPIKSIKLPPNVEVVGAEVPKKSVSASAQNVKADIKLLVIPFDQVVTVRWNLWGHAAVCHEDIARADIFTNKDGAIFRPLVKVAHGISRFPNPETVVNNGSAQLNLTAGGYIIRAISAGDYSGASITVEYSDIIPPKVGIPRWLLIGAGVGVVAGGIYLMIRRR